MPVLSDLFFLINFFKSWYRQGKSYILGLEFHIKSNAFALTLGINHFNILRLRVNLLFFYFQNSSLFLAQTR